MQTMYFVLAKRVCEQKMCRNPGSNQGPYDLQSYALPTELLRRAGILDAPIPFKPVCWCWAANSLRKLPILPQLHTHCITICFLEFFSWYRAFWVILLFDFAWIFLLGSVGRGVDEELGIGSMYIHLKAHLSALEVLRSLWRLSRVCRSGLSEPQ